MTEWNQLVEKQFVKSRFLKSEVQFVGFFFKLDHGIILKQFYYYLEQFVKYQIVEYCRNDA